MALCLVFQVQADTLLGKVINVADGDTITVLDDTNTQHKIRLAGIDAPENRQAFGNVSRLSLAEQVAGQFVAVEWFKVDKYRRKLGKVLLGGLDYNLVQVKRGLAWHYKQYQREQSPADQQSYAAAEIEASAAKLGLWWLTHLCISRAVRRNAGGVRDLLQGLTRVGHSESPQDLPNDMFIS